MRYESKTFGELAVGEHFWTFEPDCGDKELEKVKSAPGRAKWANGEIKNEIFYPSDKPVYVPVYYAWHFYLTAVCIISLILLTIAFVYWTVNYFKSV